MTNRAPAPSAEGPARVAVSAPSRTVADLRAGERAVLDEAAVGAAQRLRLAELGLRAGEEIQLLQRSVGGARVLAVHESRLAVDRGTAARLRLRP